MQFFPFKRIALTAFLSVWVLLQTLSLPLSDEIRFRHLSVENGLSNEKILAIYQSSDGYIWIGTEDGLNRYDGSEIVKFKNNELDINSIAGNIIRKIYEDKAGRLWIGTNNGLCRYVKEYQNFIRYNFDSTKKDGNRNYVWEIYEDKANKLWVGTLSGMFYLPADRSGYKQFTFPEENPAASQLGVFNITMHSNKYWFGTSEGLFSYNSELNEYELYPSTDFLKYSISSNLTTSFFVDKNNEFWIGTKWGLKNWNTANKKFSHYIEQFAYPGITSICEDKNGGIWVGSKSGLHCITSKGSFKTSTFKNSPFDPNSLSDDFVNCLFMDRSGLIWIGTNQGINIFDDQYQVFHHVKKYILLKETLKDNNVISFYEDDKYLYTGTMSGMDIYNKSENTHTWLGKNNKNKSIQNITCILQVGNKLVFSSSQGLYALDSKKPKTNSLTSFYAQSENKNFLLKDVLCLMQYDDNNILISVRGQGFYILDKNFTIKKHFSNQSNSATSLSYNTISSIVKDRDGIIWIGTRGGGLNRFDIRTGTFKVFMPQTKNNNSLSSKMINYLFVDKENTLWVGTKTGGLCKYNRQLENFSVYKENDGLASNFVVGITEDDYGNLWISTQMAISSFNKKSQLFKNYDVSDGLQGNTFNNGAVYKNNNGLIYFGGTNGYNVFNPKEVKINATPPLVDISGFSIFNKLILPGPKATLKKHVSKIDSIILKYNQNTFSFYFCALHFSRPDKNRFSYRLKGFDKEWITASSKQNFANYSNIPPGKYYFQAKACNSDGVWTKYPKTIFIQVTPPYWATWWFRIIGGFFVIYLIFTIYRMRVKGLKEKNYQLEALAQKEREINELKLTFFANISHELRTPLSLILGPLENLLLSTRNKELKNQYSLMYRNAQRLMRLLNQILDFRKLDLGKLKLEASETDIVKFTQNIIHDFQSMADAQNIELTFLATPNMVNVWLDKDKYEQIISNLLVNAFKFTPVKGSISVEITAESPDGKHPETVKIKVTDTGDGISNEDLDKIFNLFFQSENKKGGFGIGLSLVYSLIQMHHGAIKAESEKGKGATFTITLPLNKHHLTDQQLLLPKDDIYNLSEKKHGNLAKLTDNSKHPKRLVSPETSDAKTILIIEDNEDLRTFIKQELEETYHVLEANNGKEGIELAVNDIPDLIISDIMMPEINGLELCAKLKKEELTSHIPIVLLTALSADDHQQKGLEHGADDYITKPFNAKLLKLRIENQLLLVNNLRKKYSKEVNFYIDNSQVTSSSDAFLTKTVKIIENNLSDIHFSISDFAKEVGVSERQLFRKIKALTNYSPNDFIKFTRLSIAKKMLMQNDARIVEVAQVVGFNTSQYFAQCFKEQFNITPKEFRSQMRKNN